MSDILNSIYNLIKTNNGEFKSEKQSHFINSVVLSRGGFVGSSNSGYNSCSNFVKCDSKSIISLVKSRKRGDEIIWERSVSGELTSVDLKEIKKYKRRLKSVEKEYNHKIENRESGNYNGSGDITTYTQRNKELHNENILRLEKSINNLKEIITKCENKYK